ncbi:MAG: GNAT family N-acetyltransferase [Frankiaceae bacterium]|nr:GNAT family N-acetyltransferase [Frankiaceae bacterium]MBV9870592.1 GNAT family N-acetyltransferase [Frankiaceae bacterium]
MLRLLDDRDVTAALAVLNEDPVSNVFVISRVEAAGLDQARLGAQVWGYSRGSKLISLCYAGANLVPVGKDPDALKCFAEHAMSQGRRCSSIVGPAESVDMMWTILSRSWGPARETRPRQPLMVTRDSPLVSADTAVRRVRLEELDVLLPASIAMFTEEVGVSPVAGDGGALYRSRVRELIAAGRSFARIVDGRVLFKAEVGAVTRSACQVQGVWVDPAMRGRGLSESGMAAVVEACLRDVAPAVSLYVNDFNLPARQCYERVGFKEVGTFASVLF